MEKLGLIKEEMNNMKRLDDFAFEFTKKGDRLPVENRIMELRYRHYQKRMMERINKLLGERKKLIEQDEIKRGVRVKLHRPNSEYSLQFASPSSFGSSSHPSHIRPVVSQANLLVSDLVK